MLRCGNIALPDLREADQCPADPKWRQRYLHGSRFGLVRALGYDSYNATVGDVRGLYCPGVHRRVGDALPHCTPVGVGSPDVGRQ